MKQWKKLSGISIIPIILLQPLFLCADTVRIESSADFISPNANDLVTIGTGLNLKNLWIKESPSSPPTSRRWHAMWSAELCAELDIKEGIEILKFLSADEEYQVKKSVLKVLKKFSELSNVSSQQKEAIKHLMYESRRDGWVV